VCVVSDKDHAVWLLSLSEQTVAARVVEAVERLGILESGRWEDQDIFGKIAVTWIVDKWVMKQRCETELIQPCLTPVVGISDVLSSVFKSELMCNYLAAKLSRKAFVTDEA
jgi:hypothetical protein